MKHLIGFLAAAAASGTASAQVTLLVRDDRPAAILKVNESDTKGSAEAQAQRIGGSWRHLLEYDRTCGGGAAAWASDGREVRYFLVKGAATATAANAEAVQYARAYAESRPGWDAGSLRYWLNQNRFDDRETEGLIDGVREAVRQRVQNTGCDRPSDSLRPSGTPSGQTGVRG